MRKFPVELNGVANLRLLIEHPIGNDKHNKPAILQQLDLLERYILALSDAAEIGERPPYWHEVREAVEKFPTMKERVKSWK